MRRGRTRGIVIGLLVDVACMVAAATVNEWVSEDTQTTLILWGVGLALAWWAIRSTARWHRDRQQYPPGSCQSCGYDLRATPDRCPECGKFAVGRESL